MHLHLTAQAEAKSFDKPDEVREFPKGRLELVKMSGATIGRAVFEPGWRWSTLVQPLAKTASVSGLDTGGKFKVQELKVES